MKKTEIKLQYDICQQNECAVPAIIVSAGASTRMNGIDKQFLPIFGVPVVARTLMTFERCEHISKIIVVTSKQNIPQMQIVCEKYNISKLSDIVEGGSNRHESVMNGIARLDTTDEKVLIHDGARPFVDLCAISNVVEALNTHDAALCACKINDTVKKVSNNGIVECTIDRSCLYSAQTPQGVDVEKYKIACNKIPNVENLTDDASVMEAMNYTVKMILSSSKNMKITTPDDIAIAEALVKGESET